MQVPGGERLHVGEATPDDPRARELEVLNEVARTATLDLELQPMLQRITTVLQQRFSWDLVAIVTLDDELQRFVCEALTSVRPTAIHVGYKRMLGSGVVGQVASTGEPLLIDDVRTYPDYVETMDGAMSELCVPVRHRGRTIAVINLESTRPAAFREQLSLLTAVADQLSGAIANAVQYREVERRARLMEMMSEVSRTALEATDLEELLDRIVRYIYERFPLRRVTIEFERPRAAGEASDDAQRLAVPIHFKGEVLGTLALESSDVDAFTPANVVAFRAFADQVAGAIHLAKVHDELATISRALEEKTRALEDANAHLARAVETLHRISTLDGLTGVPNRRHFDDVLALEWRRGARTGTPLSLLLLDVDHFKGYNDTHGHQSGDDCLRAVGEVLRATLHRASDVIARYGGEEFTVLLPDTPEADARSVAETLRERIAATGLVTVSIGVATVTPARETPVETLVRAADDALYRAKARGRNCVV